MVRKIMLFVLLAVMICQSVVFAQEDPNISIQNQGNSVDITMKNSVESFFSLYYQSIKDLTLNQEIEAMMDDTDSRVFVTRNLKFKIKQYKKNPMLSYDLKFNYKNLETNGNLATVKVYVWCGFKYANSPDLDSGTGADYFITLKNNGKNWLISEVDSNEFEFIPYKKLRSKSGNNIKSEINKLFDTKESDYTVIETDSAKQTISAVQPNAATISPLALSSYTYNADKGSSYASHYAYWPNVPTSEELFWYEDGADCTNFVSQCVWAAYGGWIEGYTSTILSQNAQRVYDDVRQVTGTWYGSKNHVGSGKWCRVLEFHDYVISTTKTKGPYGSTFGNKKPSTFSPSDIKKGDVLQLVVTGYAGGNYGHSIYVTQAGTKWDAIKICCHSTDRKNTSLSEFINDPTNYTKMRRIRFTTGKFDK